MALKLSSLSSLQRENLFTALRVALTHHSNALEGLSLSLEQTHTLLTKGLTAHNKPLHEQLIILGFAKAYDLILYESDKKTPLSIALIKDLHYLLFKSALEITPQFVSKPIGAYRMAEVIVAGANFAPTPPHLVAQKLENLLFQTPSTLDLTQIAMFYTAFESIHPFMDGNGRTGRLVMTFQTLQNDLIPPLILEQQRQEYLSLLESCQTQGDYRDFAHFLERCQKQSLEYAKQGNLENFIEDLN
ncbi:hypothetical protein NHP21005_10170 [Helicobacter sp. NHP21005]|uniref:Fic family protein n=1 Tax=Helicobacter felistomachi TaxID=3040201 RepID=UPI002573FAA4|nr:Fic family protein [Helicobacter sp. NHP21005]BEG57329.1 hypothetical protein NHP21005_10170 [Helicobacter sp. NHP21005]